MVTSPRIPVWEIPRTEELMGYNPGISKSWTQLRDFAHTQINLQKWSILILGLTVKRSMSLVTSIYGFSCLEVGYVAPSKFAPKFGLPKIGATSGHINWQVGLVG